ncbi:hypothetical protein QCA50_015559 [Cerrena zonata]|uniref:Uncharacterized protein n=1 Tax=Cerrena zonata TaxID=2478898 RepID=A0AAW0FQB4_9APHY
MEDEGSYEYDVDSDSEGEDENKGSLDGAMVMPKISYLNFIHDWNPPDPPIQSGNYYDPDDFFEDIGKHLDRVKSFHLTIPGFQMRVLARHFNKPAPMLRTLTLGTSVPHSFDQKHKTVPRLFDGQAPSLTHLTLKNYAGWHIPLIKDLTHLSLVRLNLNDFDIYYTFLDTLQVASKLEVLVVDLSSGNSEFKRSPKGRAPVKMDNLQTLAINTATSMGTSRLLAHLALPPTACITLALAEDAENLSKFFPNDRTHLQNLLDPSELVLFWEMAEYASPMIKSGRNRLPVFATSAVTINDLSSYLRNLGTVFDLKKIHRLSSYHRLHDELRDHEPNVWKKVFKALPNLEAILYICITMTRSLCWMYSLAGRRNLLWIGLVRSSITCGKRPKGLEKKWTRCKQSMKRRKTTSAGTFNIQPYKPFAALSPYILHHHKVGQTTALDLTLPNGKPAEARITYGCQWEHGTKGDHEMFVETSVVLKAACNDSEMTMSAREDIGIVRPWWQNWGLYFGSWLMVPSMLGASYELDDE